MCKQNVGVETTSDIRSLSGHYLIVIRSLSDLVLQRPSSFIDNFEQIYY